MGGPLVLTADGKTANAAKYASACHINTAAVLGGPALISSIAIEEIFAANK